MYTSLPPPGVVSVPLLCTVFVSPGAQHSGMCPGVHFVMPPQSLSPLAQGHVEGSLLSPAVTQHCKTVWSLWLISLKDVQTTQNGNTSTIQCEILLTSVQIHTSGNYTKNASLRYINLNVQA